MKILIFLPIFLIGCASFKKTALMSAATGAVVGGAIGASVTPKNEDAIMHSLLWSGLIASFSIVTSVLLYEESDELKLIKQKNEVLEKQQSLFNKNDKNLAEFGKSQFFESSLPQKYKNLIEPGEWKLYEVDEWKDLGSGTLVHQDRVLEITEPKIKAKREF